jgi:hypothetical protein
MAMLYSAGRYANLLERANSVTLTPTADALFPAANLWDSRTSRAAKHGSNAANPEVRWDLLAATVTSGSPATIQVRAGERRVVTIAGTGNCTIRNLATGKYLTNAGAWQAGSAFCLTGAGSLSYQIESLTLCQVAVFSLSISTSASTVTEWPRWNAAAVVGHNLDAGLTVEMRSSTDNFGGSNVLEVTGAILQPSFFMLDTGGIANRYGRVLITGTNQVIPWYAEVIPCWLETAVTTLGMDHEITYDWAQIRTDGLYGEPHIYPLAAQPRRLAKWRFNMDAAREVEIRQEVILRCMGGAYPLLIVPTSSDTPPAVLYGKLDAKWATTRNFRDVWATDLTMAEGYAPTPLA